MTIVIASPDSVLRNGSFYNEYIEALKNAASVGYTVILISNRPKPGWFTPIFGNTGVQYLNNIGRQNGRIIAELAATRQLSSHDVIVIATKDEDISMAKNGGALLIAADWATSQRVRDIGIRINDAAEFSGVIDLISRWDEHWWFEGTNERYGVKALINLSTYGQNDAQQQFATKLTATVKNGGARLMALLAITARSLLIDGIGCAENLLWGVYPSSNSQNDDNEVLSDFAHRLRTTVSSVRFCKRDVPLFIRHRPSIKRSTSNSVNRLDPSDQIGSLYINPYYKESNRLKNKNVVLIDDCATYGVSFGVASALLRKAGAKSVTGIALGKFGNQLHYHEIDIATDPFSPIPANGFSCKNPAYFNGVNRQSAQDHLRQIIV